MKRLAFIAGVIIALALALLPLSVEASQPRQVVLLKVPGPVSVIEPDNRVYLLCGYMGRGTLADPFRPVIADYIRSWGGIDLRPDSNNLGGYGVFGTDVSPQEAALLLEDSRVIALGNTAIESNYSARDVLNARLGFSLTPNTLAGYLAELLIAPQRQGLCKPIRPEVDGEYRIYLANQQIYGRAPPSLKHGTITDDFNRSNSSSLGSSSEGWSWTQLDGSHGISSNRAVQDQGFGGYSTARADSDLGSTDCYAQVATYSNGDGGPILRKDNTGTLTYYLFHFPGDGTVKILKRQGGGGFTSIAGPAAVTYGAGKILRGEADGSTITIYYDGVQEAQTTDSDISTGQYAGIFDYSDGSTKDDFEASALEAGGEPSAYVTPVSVNFGLIGCGLTSWSSGAEPSWPLADEDSFLVLVNDGEVAINVAANVSNFTGIDYAINCTDASPGIDKIRLSLFKEGDGDADNLTIVPGVNRAFISDLGAGENISVEVRIEGGTEFTSLNSVNGTIEFIYESAE